MPKMKTKSGAKKRFRVTASGKVKFKPAKMRHMQMNKPKQMKRKARKILTMFKADGVNTLTFHMPYSLKKLTRAVRPKRNPKKAEGGQ
ncbi:ribosomal protein L35 [Micavibrio aeruginosavorus ARL-13]|uniref:Large ribosomal subunit protein bL35 n=2 Tax=Micavibrio aeruginosavorus TaxID=349221 RepID=G2KS32_MICAA|nr:50S ribosomal protein L35 [Micavibrio aeruginosavorus]AEP10540.1 ribosomal protein L35 [Micavibrio aeruginosavorus ARL-13]AGH98984.1 LSU ribosomal protein L35p [Micavibrio aeruginosavorus EPB]